MTAMHEILEIYAWYVYIYKHMYIYIGWVGVGWRRRCKSRLSLRELGNQSTVFLGGFLAVTTAGGRVRSLLCGENLTPHKEDDRIT